MFNYHIDIHGHWFPIPKVKTDSNFPDYLTY